MLHTVPYSRLSSSSIACSKAIVNNAELVLFTMNYVSIQDDNQPYFYTKSLPEEVVLHISTYNI